MQLFEDTLRHKGMRKQLAEQLRMKGIVDANVLSAIQAVPRHLFMESSFVQFAYRDQAFPISSGQTISQPFTVAYQTQLLKVNKLDRILEVGTGSGYQAAVLYTIGAQVFTIERQRELHIKAQQLLPKLGYYPRFFFGDGYKGLPTYGPFDGIIVTAGAPIVPEELKSQLKEGARLVIPVGEDEKQIMYVITRISENKFKTEEYGNFSFVPLLKGTNG